MGLHPTRSVKTSTALAVGIESGMLSINHHGLGLPELPFGGMKDSGYGSGGRLEAVEAYRATKCVSQGSPTRSGFSPRRSQHVAT